MVVKIQITGACRDHFLVFYFIFVVVGQAH